MVRLAFHLATQKMAKAMNSQQMFLDQEWTANLDKDSIVGIMQGLLAPANTSGTGGPLQLQVHIELQLYAIILWMTHRLAENS